MRAGPARFILALLAASLPFEAARANCPPPYSTLFACDIPERGARVEFCEVVRDEDVHAAGMPQFTYNYTVGTGPAELFFDANGYYFSTKYYDDDTPGRDTTGIGLKHGTYVYAVFISGEYLRRADKAQIHVYKSVDDFQSSAREIDIERRYCAPGSILVNWENIRP